MGTIRDALEKALADAAAKRKETNQDGDAARLLRQIKASVASPTITYKPRGPDKSLQVPARARRKINAAREKKRSAPKTPRIDGAAIDRRMRVRLLKARQKRHVPLAPSLGVYRGNAAGSSSGRGDNMQAAQPEVPSIVCISPYASVARPSAGAQLALLDHAVEQHGIALEHIVGKAAAPRELVLGIDFGSSSTKLVISDRAAGKSFAVAIADATGTRRYLLPTAVRHCDGHYSLDGEGTLYTGLKSDLLASSDDIRVRERAVAYLALAIRRARGWLFEFHDSIYRDVPIFWTLTIGIPKRQGQIDRDTSLYARLATAAWQVAGASGPIASGSILDALGRNRGRPANDDTVEVKVVPEIAAEIYGFISSESFDPKGYNIFLMVDIGGKTLDASLFHARRKQAGAWGFSFFTSVVRPLGAIELHRARIEWWQQMLRAGPCDERARRLIADLEALKQTRMFEEMIPAKATDYVAGVELTQGSESGTPDDWYRTRVRTTVRRKAYDCAFGAQLSDRQMDRVEFFLCGGGARMEIYSKVVQAALTGQDGSLFHATRRTLQIPADLIAPGLPEPEYDRFAVAYGLSHLDRASVIDAKPITPPKRRADLYEDRFVSKDVC